MIKKLLNYVGEYKKQSILSPIFVTFEVIIECIIPLIIANLVNEISAGCSIDVTLKYGAILVGLALLSLMTGWAAGHFCAIASCGFAKNLRNAIFKKVQDFSFNNIDKFSSSSLVTRLTTDVTNVQNTYQMFIRTAIRSPLMLIFSISMAYYMGGSMAAFFAFTVPFLGLVLGLGIKIVMPLFKAVFKKYDKLNESVEENIQGIRVVKSFARENYEAEKFDKAAIDVRNDFTKAERIMALQSPAMQICLYVVMLFVMYFGGKTIITSFGLDLNVGQLSSLLTYSFQVLMSLMMLSMIVVMFTISIESGNRIVEVLDEEPTIVDPANPIMEVKDGSIDFDHVNFKYSANAEKNVLNNIDLHIKSGETIGIIGGTGSSKSTLVSLISRLYDATEGDVKVGGIDVRNYDLKVLRDEVAVVLQKNVLFAGTIYENMRWGNENATDDEIKEACTLSQADSFIQEFPDKYNTMIAQGGTNVSGGQKQRLCIARALLKRPKILILDDSTSAVDTKTDALIRKGLKSYIPETTKIIIAQRTASVEDADRILVMDKGEISAIGTHAELMKTCEIYREVYTTQNKGGKEDE